MQRLMIERAVRQHVPEEDRIALASFVANAHARKIRLTAFETVIEIEQKGEDALPPLGNLLDIARQTIVQEIVMRPEFLTRHVMQQCGHLKMPHGNTDQVCHPRAQQSEHEIAVRKNEMTI